MSNVYDEARAGAFNVGRLTTTSNSAASHAIDYAPSGAERRRFSTIAGTGHETTHREDSGRANLWTCYTPSPACAGSATLAVLPSVLVMAAFLRGNQVTLNIASLP